ncbi:MAG: type II toxin-antitoxin system VapC family toxin [Deltaproteobacteria bacterium]|nr:type II toxin-antitoxin system VapC family toxin [Deltaproteobacteria bacterium]
MIALLDINVLVALAWPNHIHYSPARKWFQKQKESGWATCPATENGFIRISSNSRIIPEARSPMEAALYLKDLTKLQGHVFWGEEASILCGRWIPMEKIHTYRQVTGAHLLSLAIRNEALLATFDRGILNLLPEGMKAEDCVCVIPADIA